MTEETKSEGVNQEPIAQDQTEEQIWYENTYKGNKMNEFTPKVLFVGMFLAAIMVAMNVYMGLKIGFGIGGSLIAVILSFAVMKAMMKIGIVAGYTTLENNITQTMASAGGSIGCIVNIVPALDMLGVEMSPLKIFLWVFFTSFLGVFFAVPLRKQVVVFEKLKFPTGTAAASTIEAMHAEGSDGIKKSIILVITTIVASTIIIFQKVWDFIPQTKVFNWFNIGKHSIADYTMGIAISPMLFGVGFLVGLRVTLTMMAMGIVTWLFIAPWLLDTGIVATLDYKKVILWTMWPGIALMVTSGLVATGMRYKVFINAFKSMKGTKDGDNQALTDFKHLEVPMTLWALGLSISSLGLIIIMNMVFGVPIHLAILSIFLAFFLSIIAVRATGETDINPVSSLGNITQIIFGAIHPGSTTTTLLTAGVTYSGASEASDMMQDLKTGYLVGATPKKQFYAQLIGLTIGTIVAIPVYLALTSDGIATKEFPAVGAVTASGVAKLVSNGTKLPQHVDIALIISIILGIIIPVIEKYKPKVAVFLPSAMGLGLAMVLPAFYAVTMFAGALFLYLSSLKWKDSMEKYSIAAASGGIAGEGITGAFVDIFKKLF